MGTDKNIKAKNDKDEALKTKGKGGLKREFLLMTIFPILILGVIIVALGCTMYTRGLHSEVRNGLKAVGESVVAAYDEMYPGDYNLLINKKTGAQALRKGDKIISKDPSYINRVARETGVDISIFFYDVRLMTTIVDKKGEPVTGSVAHKIVVGDVLTGRSEAFFTNVMIDRTKYFAEYIPLFSENGTCVGMIGVAKSSDEVRKLVNKSMFGNMALIVLALLAIAVIISIYTASIVAVLQKMQKFLGDMAGGNLSTKLDETILKRQDEIGDMGRFTIRVQSSLKKLIERDSLTGLYNRRSGQQKIAGVVDNSKVFAVAMGDIDFFKKVNDTYGHDAGDEVLRVVARTLSDAMIGKGFVARWGGEEFLIVFEKSCEAEAAAALEAVLGQIRDTTVVCGEYEIKVTMSYGVVAGNMMDPIEAQIKAADNCLYYSKTHGRNQVTTGSSLAGAEVEENPDCTIVVPVKGILNEESADTEKILNENVSEEKS